MSRQKKSTADIESVILAVWRIGFLSGTASVLATDVGYNDTDAAEEAAWRASIILRDPLNREAILQTLRDTPSPAAGGDR